MRIKSYFAGTVEAALELAKRELGGEAMILNSRPAPPESRHLGEYEVIFAAQGEPVPAAGAAKKPVWPVVGSAPGPVSGPVQGPVSGTVLGMDRRPASAQAPSRAEAAQGEDMRAALSSLFARVEGLCDRVERLSSEKLAAEKLVEKLAAVELTAERLTAPGEAAARRAPEPRVAAPALVAEPDQFPADISRTELRSFLVGRGMAEELAAQVVQRLQPWWTVRTPSGRRRSLRPLLKGHIEKLMRTAPGLGPVQAFVGPSRCGKTSLILKLAVAEKFRSRQRVRMVAIEGSRVGSNEWLKFSAGLAGIQVAVAQDLDEVAPLVGLAQPGELTLVDTPGIDRGDPEALIRLARCLRGVPGMDVHLTLTGSAGTADHREVISRFEAFAASKVCLTRLDETDAIGGLLSDVAASDKRVSFVSQGQRIPEDGQAATPDLLADRFLGRDPVLVFRDQQEAEERTVAGGEPADSEKKGGLSDSDLEEILRELDRRKGDGTHRAAGAR